MAASYLLGQVDEYDSNGRMIWKALQLEPDFSILPMSLHRVDLSDVKQRRRLGFAHTTVMRHRVDGLHQAEDPDSSPDFDLTNSLERLAEHNGGAMSFLEAILTDSAELQFSLLLHDEKVHGCAAYAASISSHRRPCGPLKTTLSATVKKHINQSISAQSAP